MAINFTDQGIIPAVAGERCMFTSKDIDSLLKSDLLPKETAIKAYDPNDKADLISNEWVCFLHFPFSIGMSYPFPDLVEQFFKVTGISYSQTMPMVWRILNSLCILNETQNLEIGLPEIAACYQLRTHGHSRFILKTRDSSRQMVPRLTHSDNGWKQKFFFVKRSSIPNGKSLPQKWVREGIFLKKLVCEFRVFRVFEIPFLKKFIFINAAPRFEDLVVPAPIDSPKLIRLFEIKNRERASLSTATPSQASTSDHTPTMSSAPKSTVQKFSFSDIKSSLVKKEKGTETPSKKPARAPLTRNKKRSLEPSINLESDEDATMEESKDKILLSVNHMIQLSKKNVDEAKAELATELAAANEKIQDLQKIAAQREAHSKIREHHWKKECESVMEQAKGCAKIAVVEAMYDMAENAASEGYCHESWDLEGWAAMLDKPVIMVASREVAVEAGENVEGANAGDAAVGGAAEENMGEEGGLNAGAH